MEKGHYGQYTGNARHSRKEEMIHDRELIYDAKKQLHNADKDYKKDSPAQMNADLAYDPINDRADSPMSMYGKKESPAMMYGGKKGDDSKSKKDYSSPAKNMKNVLSGKQRY